MTARFRHLRHRELDGLARGYLRYTKEAMANGNVPGSSATYTFTATNASNVITVAGEDDLAAGNPRVAVSGADLPAGLESGTLYWLRDAGTNTYTLHPTLADAVGDTNDVEFSDDGSGTLTLTFL